MGASRLMECFGIDSSVRLIALVGAGGKTSLMYALAHEMARGGRRVVTSTTTKIFPPTTDQSPDFLLVENDPLLGTLSGRLSRFGHVTVGGAILSHSGKVDGISEEHVAICLDAADWVIVEADGAGGRPMKAPERWEPVIPSATELVIPVIGLDCLWKPASDEWVFRLERFLELTGLREGQAISPDRIATMLTHPQGGLKGVPPNARVAPFLNKTDLLKDLASVASLVQSILGRSRRVKTVVAGRLRDPSDAVAYSAGPAPE